MANSLRRISKQQFSAGTTPDGNRLERAMADAVDTANAVNAGDLRRRFVQTQIVAGWTPGNVALTQKSLPWLPDYNNDAAMWLAGTTAQWGVQNPWRFKGMNNGAFSASIDPVANPTTQGVWTWTHAIYLSRPAILHGVFAEWLVDTDHAATFDNGGTDDKAAAIVVQMDNPLAPEERRQSLLAYQRVRFGLTEQPFSKAAVPVGLGTFPGMDPMHPGGLPVGIVVNDKNLNISLPGQCRVRVALGMPRYTGVNGWNPSGQGAWLSSIPGMVLTLLEAIEE